MLANKTRVWVAGTLVLCLLLVVASWFLLISPKRAEAADLEQQAAGVQDSNLQLEARIAQLQVQFAELPSYQAELAALRQALPEDAALPTLVRDLDAMATAAGVSLMTLSPGTPVAVPTTAATPAAPAPAEGAPTEGGASTDAEAAAPATPAPAASELVSIPASVVVNGDFFQAELFLKKLQAEMPRAFLVQTLTVQADTSSGAATAGAAATAAGNVSMTIAGSVFVLRSTPVAQPATPTPVTAP